MLRTYFSLQMHLTLFVILTCASAPVQGFSSGLVMASCGDLTPQHSGIAASSSPPPFIIYTDRTEYSEGDEIIVTLQANSTQFQGFLMQAREVGGSQPVGSFSLMGNDSRLLECNGQSDSAVSQVSGESKQTVQNKWTAPQSGQLKDIEFRVTFVQNYPNFWVGVKSPVVVYNSTSTTSPATPGPFVNEAISSVGCGKSKVCFSIPDNCDPAGGSSDCYFMSATATQAGSIQFELYGSSQGYISVGFSDDQLMGQDDIYICRKDSAGEILVEHAYSTGRSTPQVLPLGDVSDIKTSFVDGVISCTFVSKNAISTQRSAAGLVYHIMFAYGLTNNGKIMRHAASARFVSPQKIDISAPQVITTTGQPQIIKAHGALMLIAWMTTGSLGMLIARFLKEATKGRKCLGKHLWFLAHVFLMVLTVAMTIIAFILSFSHVKGWSGGSHPVLGCLVMILAFFQPLAALFRCGPEHHWRFIFNTMHTLTAVAIKGLAVAAIFTGLYLVEHSEGRWLQKVMGGFVAWEALLFAMQDLQMRWRQKSDDEEVFQTYHTEVILFLVFFLGNLAFLVALLVGIGMT
ncbi:putative ferric-chelate reductase 1 [Engraulis encrasicolus]|uniref:putative ferric-chelate reductase 1 n=1 Tax=Engraulis encrasicolus TaxID=184585 RepID=UPI002FD720AC